MVSCQRACQLFTGFTISAVSFVGSGIYYVGSLKPHEKVAECCWNLTKSLNMTQCAEFANVTIRQLSCSEVHHEVLVTAAIALAMAGVGFTIGACIARPACDPDSNYSIRNYQLQTLSTKNVSHPYSVVNPYAEV